jgi:hypothetical protein
MADPDGRGARSREGAEGFRFATLRDDGPWDYSKNFRPQPVSVVAPGTLARR